MPIYSSPNKAVFCMRACSECERALRGVEGVAPLSGGDTWLLGGYGYEQKELPYFGEKG